jgi:hypothetical protein
VKRRTILLAALPLPVRAALNFPADFGAHPLQAIEWWYLTGLLGDRDGAPPRFGYQLTFFRIPGPAGPEHPSCLAARQLLLGHVALSDLRARKQRHGQRLLRGLPGAVQAQVGECNLKLRDWTLKREGDGYRAAFSGPGFSLELELATPAFHARARCPTSTAITTRARSCWRRPRCAWTACATAWPAAPGWTMNGATACWATRWAGTGWASTCTTAAR